MKNEQQSLESPICQSDEAMQLLSDDSKTQKPGALSSEVNERYAVHLQFLWEQYNKLMGLGILAAGLTIGFLLKEVVFSTSFQVLVKPVTFLRNRR